jgi:hypothetical protein
VKYAKEQAKGFESTKVIILLEGLCKQLDLYSPVSDVMAYQ